MPKDAPKGPHRVHYRLVQRQNLEQGQRNRRQGRDRAAAKGGQPAKQNQVAGGNARQRGRGAEHLGLPGRAGERRGLRRGRRAARHAEPEEVTLLRHGRGHALDRETAGRGREEERGAVEGADGPVAPLLHLQDGRQRRLGHDHRCHEEEGLLRGRGGHQAG